ncbi:MAG TPA: hypothetical protein GXX36_01820 [Clostridiaceae bacterium]|nr:hypothetical protein [Clostridiaceae bacterium]
MMKKRVIPLLLAAILLTGMVPAASMAAKPEYTSEDKPVYLGTEAEYQTTFDTMFDENGLRKVSVGFYSNNGALNEKYGFVNKYGNFVVQPIYDEIKLYAFNEDYNYEVEETILPKYFIGGYTQAVRDGKMGLLNARGEEVVPCQYDFVSLPSEGMCRVFNDIPGSDYSYLGYWNLEQNREVVKPNKYITLEKNFRIGAPETGKKKPTGDYLAVHDFTEGYAMVFTEARTDISGLSYMATIIDKNGKDILGKSYLICAYGDTYANYPQKGPYLSFQEPITIKDRTFTKIDNKNWKKTLTFNTYATGLVGPSGVLIKPTYTTGVGATVAESDHFINPARFEINTKSKTIYTEKDYRPDKLYGTGYGVIDFNGKELIPFSENDLRYSEKANAYSSGYTLYTNTYKKMNYDGGGIFFTNGYNHAYKYTGDYNPVEGFQPVEYYFVKADGSSLNVSKKFGWSQKEYYGFSEFSTTGYVWIQNKDRTKWGLIDFSGKTVLPFEFDNVDYDSWTLEANGFAVVEKNGKKGLVNTDGKLVIACSYKSFNISRNLSADAPVIIVENENGKLGLAEKKTGKFLLPVAYDAIGASVVSAESSYAQQNTQITSDFFDMGVYYVEKDGKTYLLDKNGKEVFSTSVKFHEAVDGLYDFNGGYRDNRGRPIIPDSLDSSTNLELMDSFTIYIKDGKVYRASANYLKSTFGYKTYSPEKATATPSSVKFMVNGKSVAVDAYAIGGNNYIKLRDLATMVNNTGKNFEVTWDGAKNAINLISNKPYTSVGGEMAKGDGKAEQATRTNSKIFVDGGEVSLTAYNIGGSNYFKLRDVMQIFDINVGWDGATSTATINTNEGYALTSYEQSKYDAFQKAYQEALGNPYQYKQIYDEPFIQFQSTPGKLLYKVGEPFEITGFKVVDVDVYGFTTDITSEIELKVNSTRIYDGYKFTQAGDKTVDCYYKGEKLNYFKISVIADDNKLVESGNYYLQINGKYIYPVSGGWYWMELSDKKPDKPFNVQLVGNSEERGPIYYIMYDGQYIMPQTNKDGAQLMGSNAKYLWRINKYTKFCTIRDYGNQKLLVNASGAKYDNGTKVTIWSYTGSAPEHGKITFIKAD